ncbi:MAG TPA: hypothetical protein VGX69_06795 [Solirubrobacteraceae bacterium]|nr:hypothetical protein [Solirubrobacteraceae bacterium]
MWALDTLGHATSGTFPEGGPANVQRAGGASGRPVGERPLFGSGRGETSESGPAGAPPAGPPSGGVPGQAGPGEGAGNAPSGASVGGFAGARAPSGGFGGGAFGAPMGNEQSITQALSYVKQHGGGTIAVSSQSSAASAIVASGAKVAGIGGFSGRESDVTAGWLAQRVSSGAIRWVLVEASGAGRGGRGLPGDTRAGSKAAMTAIAKACMRVTLATSEDTSAEARSGGGAGTTSSASETALYDCQGRAAALERGGVRAEVSKYSHWIATIGA